MKTEPKDTAPSVRKVEFFESPYPIILLSVGGLLTLAVLVSITALASWGRFTPAGVAKGIWDSIEWFGVICLVAVPALIALIDRLDDIEGVTHLPSDAAWWRYLVMGSIVLPITFVWLFALVGAFIVFPFIAPFRVIQVYTLGPTATVASAVIAIPLVFGSVSLAFAILYGQICTHELGVIKKNGVPLFSKNRNEGWLPSAFDALFFSTAVMVFGAAEGFEAERLCRWLVLVQGVLSKVLEVVIVAVGLALVLNRLSP